MFDCWDEDGWDMDFRRTLSAQEYNDWLELTNALDEFRPDGEAADIVLWALESNVIFPPSHSIDS